MTTSLTSSEVNRSLSGINDCSAWLLGVISMLLPLEYEIAVYDHRKFRALADVDDRRQRQVVVQDALGLVLEIAGQVFGQVLRVLVVAVLRNDELRVRPIKEIRAAVPKRLPNLVST